jgi:predicted nucleic acid-binding protein
VTAFIDTNVFVYALGDDPKSERARDVLARGGLISVQVLNELARVLLGKLGRRPADVDLAISRLLLQFPAPIPLTVALHCGALQLVAAHRLSFYDALILAAALEAGCDTLLSEDFQAGRRFGPLTVVNPFAV